MHATRYCQTTRTADSYFYQEANLFSQGSSVLQIENETVGETHSYSNQEVVEGCPSSCHLYDYAITDSTSWNLIRLPDYDNPGYLAGYQGEVHGDGSTDEMGEGVFSNPEFHAGTWHGWSNLYGASSNTPPYCNFPSTEYDYVNYGPATSC